MKRLVFHFDVISPFAYLAFEQLPQVLAGCSYEVEYRPVLFAAMLQAHAHKGPAEIEPKRQWTFRHVHWLAHQHGVAMQTPAVHPFNPLPVLRLLVASAAGTENAAPNRRVVEAAFRHVWLGGGDPGDAQRLQALREQVQPDIDPDGDIAKHRLRRNTSQALADGVFGVPTVSLDGRPFWGLDALPMVRDALLGGDWFDGPGWDAATTPPPGVVRGR